jgi:hypothetical protein
MDLSPISDRKVVESFETNGYTICMTVQEEQADRSLATSAQDLRTDNASIWLPAFL